LAGEAVDHELRVENIRNINEPESIALIKSLKPDIIFVFGWSQIVSKEILDIPPMGCVGTHPALLPKNRGRHPIVWTLVDGLEKSGLTFFFLDEEADSGDILWQGAFPIALEDDAGSVYKKIEVMASRAIGEFLPQLEEGTAPRIPQSHKDATYRRKRNEHDGEIDWMAPSMKTYNLIRALTHPYVGAHTHANHDKVIVWRTEIPRDPTPETAVPLEPGTVFMADKTRFNVRTGDGHLTVLEYEHPGGKIISQGVDLGKSK
jgi:methionyl-tRNA formyltransferase